MSKLEKVLDFKIILLITINAIMGTGIFFLPALGAQIAGPASIISWIIIAIISIYVSMCFAELVSMFPKAGGIYEYAKQAFGRFTSFILGWITIVAGNVTIAMLIVGAIQYLLPVNAPVAKIGISILFIVIFNYITYRGMKTSSVMLVAFSIITLATLFSLIIPGLISFHPENLKPFFILPTSAIVLALFYIQETFFGWETTTFLSEETKNPEKVMPKALILGTIIIAIISIVFVTTSLSTIPWQIFGNSVAPLSDLGQMHFGDQAKDVFTLLVYLAIIGSVAGWIVSAPRLLLAMARDRLFITQLASIHPKYKTPYKAIIFQTVLTSALVFIGAGAYQTLLLMLLPLVLVMYCAVLIALVKLRFTKPNLKRPYKAPLGKILPIGVIIILVSMLIMWLVIEENAFGLLRLAFSLIFLGIPLYFMLELYYNPKALRKTYDMLAHVTLATERLSLPMSIRKKTLELLGPVKGKTVLEFGCSVGTLTMPLARAVGKKGKIYATDISKKDIEIVKKRIKKHHHSHVKAIHDNDHHKQVHPSVPNCDHVVSVGNLAHVNDIHQVLKHMSKRLKKHSRIVFVDYEKFFDLIPNKEWLDKDETIKRTFKNAGFTVNIERKQGLAWRYIFIYGQKN
jgi:amino acid transporter/precorrin-6B methylase 2